MEPATLLLAGVAAGAGYLIAYRRRGTVASAAMTARRLDLRTPADPAIVFAAITSIGPPYRVDYADQERRIAVLSSRPSIWSYGFLYPVIVHPTVPNGSRIEIGVSSRFFHVGPGMGRAHLWCAKAIESLLTVPPARQIDRS